MILVDTSVLARFFEPGDPQHQPAVDAAARLHNGGQALRICSQNLVELYAIATRDKHGLGMTPAQALQELAALKTRFPLLPEVPLHDTWERLAAKYGVTNRRVFDLRLMIAAVLGGCSAVLTFNTGDFRSFAEITVMDPYEVLGTRPG